MSSRRKKSKPPAALPAPDFRPAPRPGASADAPKGATGRGEPTAGRAASDRRVRWLLTLLLFLAVAGVFLPAIGHDFITYDDPSYVTGNAHVTGGLTWESVRWAFRSTDASNWHPLTWLSHMADCQLYGLRPWGHHLTSVLLHALNAVLLFVVLRRMTGAVGRSLVVAALFGLHPLHVESVAWIAERKDVLSTCFGMLVLWAYARRVGPNGEPVPRSGIWMGAAVLFFALSLMSKPMLVTIPGVLLLLDFWPLRRWERASVSGRWALVLEKLPFLALAAASSAITLFAQGHGGTVQSVEDFPWPVRLANAVIAGCQYLGKCFVPVRLAVFYPFVPEPPPLWQPLAAGLLLVGITAAAVACRRRRPYLPVGWFWFVGTLVPVIGLVQIGGQSMADRYSYVPLIGVFILVVWAAGDLVAASPRGRRGLGLAVAAILIACAVGTSRQLAFWRDGVRLFRHALDVTTNDNWVAHANLYLTLAPTRPAESSAEFRETVRILGAFAERFDRRGLELERTGGDPAEAIKAFRTAVRILRVLPGPHCHLGAALAKDPDHLPEALEEFQEALRLQPDLAEAYRGLGAALAQMPGRSFAAIEEYRTALRLRPDDAEAHAGLGSVLATIPGRQVDAIEELEIALRLRPDLEPARALVGRLRAGTR